MNEANLVKGILYLVVFAYLCGVLSGMVFLASYIEKHNKAREVPDA